jgi:hypothetical protein
MRTTPILPFLSFVLLLAVSIAFVPFHPYSYRAIGRQDAGHHHGMALAAISVASVSSGDWSSGATWSTGVAPAAGDNVTIMAGHTVIYNAVSDVVLGDVTVMGTLKFSRTVNARLKTAGNVLVLMGGHLDMGVSGDVVPAAVKSKLVFVLTDAQSKAYVGGPAFQPADKGLWVMDGGRWDAHGSPVKRTWSKLSQDGMAGSFQLTVDNDVLDWPVGGTVVDGSSVLHPGALAGNRQPE